MAAKKKDQVELGVALTIRGDLAKAIVTKASEFSVSRGAIVRACVRGLIDNPRLRELAGQERGGRRLATLEAKKARIEAEIRKLKGVA